MAILPMFPLGSVLLPGAVLPLHVFEPRYRALVRDCLAADEHEFGVTMIERGSEVGGGDVRMPVGTVARMLQVAELADGRYALVCAGTRRIRVTRWLPDDPYPIADVEDWPDEPRSATAGGDAAVTSLAERVRAAEARVRRLSALATELGDSVGDGTAAISDDPQLATFHLAALAPIGPADTYRVLCAPGTDERLRVLHDVLDDVDAVLSFRMAAEADPLARELDGDDGDGGDDDGDGDTDGDTDDLR